MKEEKSKSKKIPLTLLPYQKEAVQLAINTPFHLIAVRTGQGKSIISVFYSRILLKKDLADKIILCSTKTGVNSMHKAFGKAGVTLNQYDDVEDALNFFSSDEKLCVWKHSMIEKIGMDEHFLSQVRNLLSNNYKRIAIVIDECHKLSNDEGILHNAFMNLRFVFERISLQTATIYGSQLTSLYGVVHLIYPKLWRSKRAFCDDHVEERTLFDRRTRRVRKKEIIAYKNLNMLREKLEKFTYFYYPPVNLTFIEHKTRLKSYEEYDNLCAGIIPESELKNGENHDKTK